MFGGLLAANSPSLVCISAGAWLLLQTALSGLHKQKRSFRVDVLLDNAAILVPAHAARLVVHLVRLARHIPGFLPAIGPFLVVMIAGWLINGSIKGDWRHAVQAITTRCRFSIMPVMIIVFALTFTQR